VSSGLTATDVRGSRKLRDGVGGLRLVDPTPSGALTDLTLDQIRFARATGRSGSEGDSIIARDFQKDFQKRFTCRPTQQMAASARKPSVVPCASCADSPAVPAEGAGAPVSGAAGPVRRAPPDAGHFWNPIALGRGRPQASTTTSGPRAALARSSREGKRRGAGSITGCGRPRARAAIGSEGCRGIRARAYCRGCRTALRRLPAGRRRVRADSARGRH